MNTTRHSLLKDLPTRLDDELVEELLRAPAFRIERIVSTGQHSEEGFWYDQEEHEWVMVVSGRAWLRCDDPPETVELGAGDALLIPAHRRHRVERTDPDVPTVWLAVFWTSEAR